MAANEVSIIANVGTLKQGETTVAVYLGEVNSKYGLFHKVMNTALDPDAEQWAFLTRDAFLVGVVAGDASFFPGVNVQSMLNDGNSATYISPVTGNDWKVTVINDNSLPRLYNNQPFLSLRGQGIATIDPTTATYSNTAITTSNMTLIPSASTSSSLGKNPLEALLPAATVTFLKDNALWITLITLVVAYLWYTEKQGKGKKKSKFLGLF